MRVPSATASAGIGGGLGAALGSALGAPGASIRNLLDGITGGQGGEDGDWMKRILPGLLAAGGGGLVAALGGGIPLAMMAAAGVGGLGQAVGESTGDTSFDPISGKDLAGRLGANVGDLGGMGIEMALDPTTYAGGLGGRAASSKLGGTAASLEAAAAPAAAHTALEASGGAARTLEQAAAHTPASGTRNSWEAFLDHANDTSRAGYRPEVIASTPDFLKADPSKIGKAYKQLNPQAAEDLSLLGYVNKTGETSGTLNAGQLPAWAESRGGWVMPSRERMASQADPAAGLAMMRHPDALAAVGPKLDHAAGYEGLLAQKLGPSPGLNLTAEDLMSQADKFDLMRQGVPGLGGPRGVAAPSPGLDDPIHRWLRQRRSS